MANELEVGSRTLELTNLDKVLFPDDGYTKAELIEYYIRVAEYALPYYENRPLMMHRFPDGIGKQGFYQKDAGKYFPKWIDTATIKKEEGTVDHVVCNEAATFAYLAQQGTIALHTWLSRVDKLDHPDQLIFDLDPSDDDFTAVRRAARQLHELLDELELASYVKTTGSRGLHVVVALDRKDNYDTVRTFARDVAGLLASRDPQQLTVEIRKQKRCDRIFIDTNRNAYAQTAVAPYSVRAKAGAPVATPLDWSEVSDSSLRPDKYNIKNLFRRLSRKEDPWRDIRRRGHSLRKARQALKKLRKG